MDKNDDFFARTVLLVGNDKVALLRQAHVLVVGLGGVGGYAAEQLCRAGIGRLTIVDSDVVTLSNINRQIIALHSTVGRKKTALFKERMADINPECQVEAVDEFLRDERMVELLQALPYDYVVDAIDTLSPKVFLLYHAHRLGLPTVSSMGSAGKLDPMQIHVADIADSTVCPLARMVRKQLHRLGVTTGIQVVYSTEELLPDCSVEDPGENKRTTIGTVSYMPPLFGCCVASVAIRGILGMADGNSTSAPLGRHAKANRKRTVLSEGEASCPAVGNPDIML